MSQGTTILVLAAVAFGVVIIDKAPAETMWVVQVTLLGAIAAVVGRGNLPPPRNQDPQP